MIANRVYDAIIHALKGWRTYSMVVPRYDKMVIETRYDKVRFRFVNKSGVGEVAEFDMGIIPMITGARIDRMILTPEHTRVKIELWNRDMPRNLDVEIDNPEGFRIVAEKGELKIYVSTMPA